MCLIAKVQLYLHKGCQVAQTPAARHGARLSVRPQLSDLVLDAATFAAAEEGRVLAHCVRNIAVIAGDEDEETKLANYLPIPGFIEDSD
jgi:hypothetical protein